MIRWKEHAVAAILFAAGTVLLFLSAPHNGEFWWSDAPRHALNGVFIKDLVEAMPAHPAAWAMQYYVHYPALTILFYPPLFYAISAPFYAVFGVSEATALGVVLLHYFALACGLYLLARRWVGPLAAIAVGLAALAAPGMAFWGRQVMLEVPSTAFAIWAALFMCDYVATKRPRSLWLACFLLLCATWTKITAAFLFPLFALVVIAAHGIGVLRERRTWIVATLTVVGLLPLIWLTLKFGAANVQSVVGIRDATVSRGSILGWIWYARQMPSLVGWPLLALGVMAVPLALSRRVSLADRLLVFGWFLLGYLFLSAIDLKEARHALIILPPVLLAAGIAIEALLPMRMAGAALLAVAVGTGVYTWREAPTPSVAGYREAAEWIAREAPKDAVVVFSGKRDGSFIFNTRTLARHDISILRADKLLLDIAVRRTLGVQEKDLSEQDIVDLLDRNGVSYVVAQEDFWTDLPVMARLQSALRSQHFTEAARIPVIANVPVVDKTLVIYRNNDPISSGPHLVDLNLPIIGETVKGAVGH